MQEKSKKKEYDLSYNSTPSCIRCNNILRISDDMTGEIICGICGYVISEKNANFGYETRSFSDETSKQRTGNNLTLAKHDMGLSTVINPINKDVKGNILSQEMTSTVKRLRIWEKRSNKNIDKNYKRAFDELERIKEKIVVSDAVVEKAAYLYRKIVERKLTNGRNISVFAVASLYVACRISETPRTVKDLQKASGVSRRELTRYYRLMINELDLQIPVVDPIQCVSRIANDVGISEKTKRFAIGILHKAKQRRITDGKDPSSIAAIVIYIACKKMKEILSLRKIALAANITELTIRNGKKKFQILVE